MHSIKAAAHGIRQFHKALIRGVDHWKKIVYEISKSCDFAEDFRISGKFKISCKISRFHARFQDFKISHKIFSSQHSVSSLNSSSLAHSWRSSSWKRSARSGCLLLVSTTNADHPQQRWIRQLLRGSALLPRPSTLKFVSLLLARREHLSASRSTLSPPPHQKVTHMPAHCFWAESWRPKKCQK